MAGSLIAPSVAVVRGVTARTGETATIGFKLIGGTEVFADIVAEAEGVLAMPPFTAAQISR